MARETPDLTPGYWAYRIHTAIRIGSDESTGAILAAHHNTVIAACAKRICVYCNDPAWQEIDERGRHKSPYTDSPFECKAQAILALKVKEGE